MLTGSLLFSMRRQMQPHTRKLLENMYRVIAILSLVRFRVIWCVRVIAILP